MEEGAPRYLTALIPPQEPEPARPGCGCAQGLASQPAEPPPSLPLGRGHLVSIKAQPPGRTAPGG